MEKYRLECLKCGAVFDVHLDGREPEMIRPSDQGPCGWTQHRNGKGFDHVRINDLENTPLQGISIAVAAVRERRDLPMLAASVSWQIAGNFSACSASAK